MDRHVFLGSPCGGESVVDAQYLLWWNHVRDILLLLLLLSFLLKKTYHGKPYENI